MIVKPADRTGKVQEYYFSQKLAQIDKMRREEVQISLILVLGAPIRPLLKIPLQHLYPMP